MIPPRERALRRRIAQWIRAQEGVPCRCPECSPKGVPHTSWLASLSLLAEGVEEGRDIVVVPARSRDERW